MSRTQTVPGDVKRIRSAHRVEARLDLGLGVSVIKHLMLEGLTKAEIPDGLRNQAFHCLVMALGGRRILAHIDLENADGHLPARIYLDNANVTPDPAYMEIPYGRTEPRLAIVAFMRWLSARQFDDALVRQVLSGERK